MGESLGDLFLFVQREYLLGNGFFNLVNIAIFGKRRFKQTRISAYVIFIFKCMIRLYKYINQITMDNYKVILNQWGGVNMITFSKLTYDYLQSKG